MDLSNKNEGSCGKCGKCCAFCTLLEPVLKKCTYCGSNKGSHVIQTMFTKTIACDVCFKIVRRYLQYHEHELQNCDVMCNEWCGKQAVNKDEETKCMVHGICSLSGYHQINQMVSMLKQLCACGDESHCLVVGGDTYDTLEAVRSMCYVCFGQYSFKHQYVSKQCENYSNKVNPCIKFGRDSHVIWCVKSCEKLANVKDKEVV